MATLEKIRSKSVLLFVIIIVALLAFILGDFLTSGRTYFGSGTTVAEAAGAKVDYHAYQARLSQLSEQYQAQGRQFDNDVMSQNVIQELLVEQLLNKEYDRLGITVTDAELTAAMTGDMPHPAAARFISGLSQQLGLPAPSGSAVYDAMTNPAKYGLTPEIGNQIKTAWAATEADVEAAMKNEKFNRLVAGLFTANKLDAQSVYNDGAEARSIAYTSKNLSAASDVDVTDADVQAVWQENKEAYRLNDETRAVEYILVSIEPSQADRLAGQKEVEDALMALNSQPGTDGVSASTRFLVNRMEAPASQITNRALKAFADTASVGSAVILSHVNDSYTLAKLIGKKNNIDSIQVSYLMAQSPEMLDSALTAVRGGATMASLSDGRTMQGIDSTWTSLGGGFPEALAEKLTNATVGEAFAYTDSIQGQQAAGIYRVERRHAPVAFYDLAVIEYTIDPSNETLAQLSTDLNTFLAANSSADDFSAHAAENGYNAIPAMVSASTAGVGNARDSRGAVKWAMEARKGQVSPSFQDNKQTYIMAVAVKDIYDGDYLPATAPAINDQLRQQALGKKRGEALAAKYAGKANNVAGYAAAMESKVDTINVVFSQAMLPGIGFNESAIQGAVANAQKGAVTGPVAGNNAVVVFEVLDTKTEGRPYNFDEYAARFNQSLGINHFTPIQLLLGKNKVKNYSLNFVQSAVQD
ncbi:MAG: SurA N-terminal domain-containing protein [Muribaculaceae bacterium]|nr:SurA N-terminal domain-containing protein [Muribaculaceae bacterium]